MESILHQNSKILLEARRTTSNAPCDAPPMSPPPSYSNCTNAQIDDEFGAENDEAESPAPHVISIDASTTIEGDFNVVGTDVAEMGARASAVLSSILRSPELDGIPLHISLNCSVRIIGQKNVIANLRMKPAPTNSNAVATHPEIRKRSADEASLDSVSDPKRPNTSSN